MENNSKLNSFIAIGFSLIALALGIASIFLSINSVETFKENEISLSEKSDKALATAIESKKALAEISALKKEISVLQSAIKQNSDTTNKNVKDAFAYHAKSVNENRGLIIANQKAIEELALRPALAKKETTPEPQESPKQAQADSTQEEQDSEFIIYIIKSGDYFSKLAKQFNVTVEAIEKANPNASSTALQIGQKINIPKSK